jgi:lipoprotein-releasing system permease protein
VDFVFFVPLWLTEISMPFELWVALRYLKARRKQAVLSVITVISIIGVTAGVASLVIALAVTNGFRRHLQRSLLSAIPHVNLMKVNGEGISNWRELIKKLEGLPHVVAAAPAVYAQVLLSGPQQSQGAMLKGVLPEDELRAGDLLRHLKAGSIARLSEPPGSTEMPAIILGSDLADALGLRVGDTGMVTSPRGRLSPLGELPRYKRFLVAGIFDSGFYNYDAEWAFVSLKSAQQLFLLDDLVSTIGLRVDDLYQAPQIAEETKKAAGAGFGATNWIEQNRTLFGALRFERTVTVLVIGLIVFVAALNLFIRLYLLVVEKNREIAVLMAMGAKPRQVRRIFQYQGLAIGGLGTALGLAAGYFVSWLGSHYRLIRLETDIYSISYVPFEARAMDGCWIALAAMLISYLATVYPAQSAAAIVPAEALRYE